jgi:hypothetical protein
MELSNTRAQSHLFLGYAARYEQGVTSDNLVCLGLGR